MYFYSTVLLVSAAFTVTLGSPGPSFVVHEETDRMVASRWTRGSRLDGSLILPLRIALRQNSLDEAHDLLARVSEHDSPAYGQHYTERQINDLFAPLPETVAVVRGWLQNAGIKPERVSQSVNLQWLQLSANIMELESLLETTYYSYQHDHESYRRVGCERYHLPAHIQDHVDYITPGVKQLAVADQPASSEQLVKRKIEKNLGPTEPTFKPLPLSTSEIASHGGLAHCDVAITPACILRLYNISTGTKATEGNELGIFETINDVYSQPDLDDFFEIFATSIPNGTHPQLESINGAVAPYPLPSAGGESSLDFQISYPIIYPQQSVLYQTNNTVNQALGQLTSFDVFLDAIDGSYCVNAASSTTGLSGDFRQCGVYKPTNVVSLSYGSYEYEYPVRYQRRMCNEFLKLGLRGASVLFASGDSGIASRSSQAGNTNGCLGRNGTIYNPDFPANCPWVTSVGATYLPPSTTGESGGEVAVVNFGSGGGFSNIYETPEYQRTAVSQYFAASNTSYPYYETVNNRSVGANGGIYNRGGRGYPDVAAIGDNIVISTAGKFSLMHGTSASTPVFAAILTRINEERLAIGKSTVGFVNPVLYRNPQALNDIVTGNNSGCGTPGFFASKGWDPVTGLGTPRYENMLELFIRLP